MPLRNCQQFRHYSGEPFVSCSTGDNCFKICGRIGLIRNIIHDQETGYILFEEFLRSEPFFDDPLRSSDISIYLVSNLSGDRKLYPLTCEKSKYFMVPCGDRYVVMPLLHFGIFSESLAWIEIFNMIFFTSIWHSDCSNSRIGIVFLHFSNFESLNDKSQINCLGISWIVSSVWTISHGRTASIL